MTEDRPQRRDFTVSLPAREPFALALPLKRGNIIRSNVRNQSTAEFAVEFANVLAIIGAPEGSKRGLRLEPFLRG